MATTIDQLKSLFQKAKKKTTEVATQGFSNFKGNVSALSNPETRKLWIKADAPVSNVIRTFSEPAQQMGRGVGGAIRSPFDLYFNQKNAQIDQRVQDNLRTQQANFMKVGNIDAARDRANKIANVGQQTANRQIGMGQQLQQDRKDAALGTVRTGIQLLGAKGLNPQSLLGTAGLTGGIGYGATRLMGGSNQQALNNMGTALGNTLTYRGINKVSDKLFTNPIMNRVAPGNMGARVGFGAGVNALANLGEDEVIARTEGKNITNQDRLTSLAMGAVMGGGSQAIQTKQFLKQVDNERTQLTNQIEKAIKEKKVSKELQQSFDSFTSKYDEPVSKLKREFGLQTSAVVKRINETAKSTGKVAKEDIQDLYKIWETHSGSPKLSTYMTPEEIADDLWKHAKKTFNQGGFVGKIDDSASVDTTKRVPILKPKKLMLKQAEELLQQGQPQLEANRVKAEINLTDRSMYSDATLKDINKVKSLSRSKAFQEGDIETLRAKDPQLIDRVVEAVRESRGDESIPDTQALDMALNTPTKASTKVTLPNEIKEARALQQKAKELRDFVFNSETDLVTKEKVLKDNQDLISKSALDDFNEWQKVVTKQEGLKTSKGQVTRNIDTVAKTMKNQTIPGYVKEIKSDISNTGKGMTDVYRHFDRVFGKGSQAHKEILEPFNKSKGQFVTDLNTWADDLETNIIKKLGIKKGSKESALVQQFGEKKIDYKSLVSQVGETKAKNIVEADQWFRQSYNRLLEEVNNVRRQIYPNDPDKIINPRNDYYRHFFDLSGTINGLKNLFDTPANISPELAGLSARTLPKSKWLSFAQKRLGDKTTNDAVGGFIEYIKAQSYAKNIDPNIDRFRQLREDIVTATEDQTKPNYASANNFVEFLDDFSNDLAGKTNEYDRALQKVIGRQGFRVLNWLNSRTKANLIVGNLSSAVAQFFNIPQGIAEAGVVNSSKGMGRTISDIFNKNGEINKSNFVKERYSGDIFDRFDTGVLDNVKKAAVWITGVGDEIGTKLIWNSVYEQALAKGIKNPIEYTDDITRKMVAGRGIGEVPLLQKAKSFQLIAPFQLEVANVWHVMKDWAGEKQAGKFVTFFVASHIMNRMAANLRGSDVSLDPIQSIKEAYQAYQEEDNKRSGAIKAGGRLAGEVFSNIPIVGQPIAGMYDEFGGGALGAITEKVAGEKITRKDLFGEGDPTRFGGGLLAVKGLSDPLYNLVPSFGGKQIQRTIEGIKSYGQGFSQSNSGRVRFPIKQNITNALKSATFGQYSTPEARAYFDNKDSVLGEKQTDVFKIKSGQDRQNYYDTVISKRDSADKPDSKNKKIGATQWESYFEVPDYSQLPESNNQEKAIKASKRKELLSKVLSDEDVDIDSQVELANKLGEKVTKTDIEYYKVANLDNDIKTGFVLDEIGSMESKERMTFLESLRVPVVGKMILADGVIDDLYDQGLVSSSEKKYLKSLDYEKGKDGKITLKKGKGKKIKVGSSPTIKKVSIKAPQVAQAPKIDFNIPTAPRVSIKKSGSSKPRINIKDSSKRLLSVVR